MKQTFRFANILISMLFAWIGTEAQKIEIGPLVYTIDNDGKAVGELSDFMSVNDLFDVIVIPANVASKGVRHKVESIKEGSFPYNVKYLKIEDSKEPLYFPQPRKGLNVEYLYIGRDFINRVIINAKTIIVGKNVTDLKSDGYDVISGADTIIVQSELPVFLDTNQMGNILKDIQKDNNGNIVSGKLKRKFTLIVPKGTKQAYKRANVWKEMDIIERDEPTAIENYFNKLRIYDMPIAHANAHFYYEKAENFIKKNKVIQENTDGRTPRIWAETKKNKDGSYSYLVYRKNTGGHNGHYYPELAQTYLFYEIKVSKNAISYYREDSAIVPSDFYTPEETSDIMKIGSMKVPKDPFNGGMHSPLSVEEKHKIGVSSLKEQIWINDKTYTINVKKSCSHSHQPLYRGSVMPGLNVGVGVYTNSRGKRTVVKDHFPDFQFKHKVTYTIPLDEIARETGMKKELLIAYMIEHKDDGFGIPLLKKHIYGVYDINGFIYCAYRAFELDKHKALITENARQKILEHWKQEFWFDEQDSIRLAKEQEIQKQQEAALRQQLGADKTASLEKAEKEGVKLVDLGLSVLWADRNVGADDLTDQGNLYAWGEIEPKTKSSDSKYNPIIKLKKGAVLDSASDPATVRWGTGWHVPTEAQWRELINKCTIREHNSRMGIIVIGPNGNSIFLPFSNYYKAVSCWANNASPTTKNVMSVIFRKGNNISIGEIPFYKDIYSVNPKSVILPVRAVME